MKETAMSICNEPSLLRPIDWCVQCQERCGTQTLLTSMVRYYRCSRCGGSWQFTRGRDGLIDRSERVGGRGGRQFSLLVGPKVAQIRVTDTTTTPNVTLVAAASPKPLLAMVPGESKSGSLTQFAVTSAVAGTMVDVSMDAAVRADCERLGDGVPRERHPPRISRWTSLVTLIAEWRVR